MKKVNSSKALYHFTKKQKNKYSISTQDLNDSLDAVEISPLIKSKKNDKIMHQRAQSCPSIENQPKIPHQSEQNRQKSKISNKVKTTRSHGNGKKANHLRSHSPVSIQSLSLIPSSMSIENLSSLLYRKNTKEKSLKKLSIGMTGRNRKFGVNSQLYNKVKIQQHIKRYELNQQLVKLQKQTQGITLKQQILQSLLNKFQSEGIAYQRQLLSS